MRSRFSRRQSIVASSSLLGYVLVSFSDGVVALDGFLLVPSAGLAIPLGILFGIPATLGLVSGAIIKNAIRSNISPLALLDVVSVFLLAYLPYTLYRHGVGDSLGPENRTSMSVVRFVSITLLACCGAAAFLAWAYELVGASPFYVTVLYSFVEYLLATLVVAPLFGLLVSSGHVRTPDTVPRGDSAVPSRPYRRLLVAIFPLWAVLGTVGSVGFQIRESISFVSFRRRGIDLLYHLVHPDVFGRGGRRAQVVFGTVMILLVITCVKQLDGHRAGGG